MGAALLRIRPRADVYDVGRVRVSSVCETLLGVFGAVAPVVVVFSPIRTIPASADWERSEA